MSQFLNNKGGYRNLRVYRLSEIIYDLTMIFAKQYIRAGSRTRDQIEQAARTNVAKASLEELLLDYEDFLRQNKLPQWHKNHPRTIRLREYLKSDDFLNNPTEYASAMNAEEFCNLCITLINQATYMLRRLIDSQQNQFLQKGGIREQMYAARTQYRTHQSINPPTKSKKSD